MASSSIIQPTAFPRLDDLWTPIQREHNDQTAYKRLGFSFAKDQKAHPRSRNDLLESYSQFIASYTGQSEVTFQYALRTEIHKSVEPEIVHFRTFDGGTVTGSDMTDDYVLGSIQHTQQQQEDTRTFDFGLEIIADVDCFDSAEAPSLLSCPFLVQYHAMEMALTLRYDNRLMDEDYADAIFKMLVNHISRMQVYSDQETRLSILNHPPLQQPSSLKCMHSDKVSMSLLHSGFLSTLKEYPDRHALEYRSATTQFTMTYRQLDIVTTALAHKLRNSISCTAHGAQLIVPAYMEASAALYISWLAVLKAGFVFCPLPVGATAIELQSIVQDICAAVVLTDGPMLCGRPWDAWYCDGDDLTTCLDINEFVTKWMRAPNVPDNKTLSSITETDLAYIMYSSSSLGMPVGVKMTHSAAASTIASYSKQIPSHMRKRGYRWLASSCPTSHTSILEIFSTWWTGGTLCSVGPIHHLSTAINRVSATITTATALQASTLDLSRVPSLRHLWCQGSVPSSLLPDLTTNSHAGPYSMLTILNLYIPPNNNTGPAGFFISTASSPQTRHTVIGSPLPTTGALLLCPKTKTPVPLGSVGDLYISGSCLPSGFLHRSDLDAVFFFSDPTYGRLFKTGDRGRLVRDGRGGFVVEVLQSKDGEMEIKAPKGQSSSGRESVASMVDSFTEVGMLEGDKEADIADANVLGLIGKMCT